MSGTESGVPIPSTISRRHRTSRGGSLLPDGAVRSRVPRASTPLGWNSRRCRTAAPISIGQDATSGDLHATGCPPRRPCKRAGLDAPECFLADARDPAHPRRRRASRAPAHANRCGSPTATRSGASREGRRDDGTRSSGQGWRRSRGPTGSGTVGGSADGTGPRSDRNVRVHARISGSSSISSCVRIQNGGRANSEVSSDMVRRSNLSPKSMTSSLGVAASNSSAGAASRTSQGPARADGTRPSSPGSLSRPGWL